MKNAYLFSLVLFVSTGIQSMETGKEELPDIQKEQNILANYYSVAIKQFHLSKGLRKISSLIENGEMFGLTEKETKEIIQKFQDEDGNTFTHYLVTQQDNKNLNDCAKKELISFKKNKQDLSAYNIAFTNFSNALKQEIDKQEIDNKNDNDDDMESLNGAKCSYLILANYIRIKQDKRNDCVQCCPTHNFFDKDSAKEI